MSVKDDNPMKAGKHSKSRSGLITLALLKHVCEIAESCKAEAIFVDFESKERFEKHIPDKLNSKVIYIIRPDSKHLISNVASDESVSVLEIPGSQLSRFGRVKITILLAIGRKIIKRGDVVIFLSGKTHSEDLDTITAVQVGKEHEVLSVAHGYDSATYISPEVIERVIDMATQLGSEGREGTPLGALFVVGDTENVLPLTRQLILNPFQGYPEDQRNMLDEALEETVKELATIDGAFIIRGDGLIVSAGAYLKATTLLKDIELPRGLGSRHYAAAAITASTDAIAMTVSKSTGKVTIFRSGRIVTEIEKASAREFITEPATSQRLSRSHETMVYNRFSQLIKTAVVLDLEERIDSDHLFKTVSEHMSQRLRKTPEEIYTKLIEREKETSTAVSPELAIPHIIIDGTRTVDVLMARCRTGIYFSEEAPEVKIVFVVAGTRDERNFHLHTLASIAQIMQESNFEEQWLTASGPQAIKQLVLSKHRKKV